MEITGITLICYLGGMGVKLSKLDDNIIVAMQKIQRIHELMEKLPGYDCGSCGSPTCETFAEDIVNGQCREMDCIHLMKAEIQRMAQEMVDLAQTKRE